MNISDYGLGEGLPYIGISVLNILLFFVTIAVGFIVVKLISRSLKKSLLKYDMQEILAEFLTRVVRILLYVFVIGTALSFLGIEIGAALIGLSVVIGFVLGFSLKDTLSNIAAGAIISITSPFESGDYVKINGEEGTIQYVGISLTEMDTSDNRRVIIPNSKVWGGNIINFTKNEKRRLDIETKIGDEEDVDIVMETSMNVVKSHTNVLNDPEPQVKVKSFGGSDVTLSIRSWVKTEDYWDTFFDLQRSLKEAYEKGGVHEE